MGRLSVVSFRLDHVEDVLIIEKLSFSIPWNREAFINEIANNHLARYVVCMLGEKVAGYGGMWLIAGEAHITNIAVHPEYRKIGAASSILDGLLSICRQESITEITLEVRESNKAALNLYTKFGFLSEGLRHGYYEDNKENAIIMWKHNIK